MFNLTPNNTQQPVTPYALGLTPEQLAQMNDPNKGIVELAKALVGGVGQYNNQQQQQNALKAQQLKMAPQPQFTQNVQSGAINPVTNTSGAPVTLPPNANVIGIGQPPKPTMEEQIEEYQKKQDIAEKEKEKFSKVQAKEKKEINTTYAALHSYTDDQINAMVDDIISGKMSPTDILGFKNNRSGYGAQNWAKLQTALQAKGWNDYAFTKAVKFDTEPMNMNLRNSIATVKKDENTLKDIATEYNLSPLKSWNAFVNEFNKQSGSDLQAMYNSALQGYTDSLSLALGSPRSSGTDKRLDLSASTTDKDYAVKALLGAIDENDKLVTNRSESMDIQGVDNYLNNYKKNTNSTSGTITSKYPKLDLGK